MAQTFKNAKKVLTASSSAIYTVPSATTAIIIGCQVTNVGVASHDLTMSWTDSSDGDAEIYLAELIPIPDAAAYEPIGGRLVLEAGDVLKGLGDTTEVLEVTVSILEIS
jgi:hypothetical protein